MNSAGRTNSERGSSSMRDSASVHHSASALHSQRGGIISSMLFLFILIGLVCIMYVARHPLLRLAGSYWVVDEEPENSDVIVILGDDNFNGDRATRAAELYKSGFAPHIIASGRFLRPYASISELEQHDLTDRGVPQAAIVRLTHMADDTREECIAIGQQLNSRGWRKVILVTSNYHTRRSRYICERVFPAGTILHMAAARDSEYNPDSWWESRRGLKIYFHEFVGMPVAIWELRHNSVQTSSPGLMDSLRKHVGVWTPENFGNLRHRVYSGEWLYYSASTV
jgi:uncharacterized SAM-binding protein YcdF (DUF218 family)